LPRLSSCCRYRLCGKAPALRGLVYLDFYGLKEPPFSITPNPKYLFYSGKHREALNHLLYGIRDGKGFVQITGEVGAGKTTLCRAMLEQLGENYSTALILNPVLDADQPTIAAATRRALTGSLPSASGWILR